MRQITEESLHISNESSLAFQSMRVRLKRGRVCNVPYVEEFLLFYRIISHFVIERQKQFGSGRANRNEDCYPAQNIPLSHSAYSEALHAPKYVYKIPGSWHSRQDPWPGRASFSLLSIEFKMHIGRSVFLGLLPVIAAQETILGVYIFHRHGDRSTKSYPPTHLTDLGYAEVFQSGSFYRSRYVDSNATNPIFGISSDLVKGSQLSVQSPTDDVLQNSAAGFLQGLYPPVGATLGSESIANGSTIESPLNGFQLIPVSVLAPTSAVSQPGDAVWLEGTTGCENAIVSSNNYFLSQEFQNMTSKTASFYQTILPVINNTFTAATDIYKNAYASKQRSLFVRACH